MKVKVGRHALRALGRLALALAVALPAVAFTAPGPARVTAAHWKFTASLDQAQEVPAPAPVPGASGLLTMSLDDAQTAFSYTLTVSGLSGPAVGAHIHLGPPGMAGPIIFVLPTTFPAAGTLTAADLMPKPGAATFAEAVAKIQAGEAYVNVHTALNPAGEIRGQISELPACTVEVDGSYGSGSMSLGFAFESSVPTTWNLYILIGSVLVPAASVPLPVLHPALVIPPISFPFPDLGGVLFVSTLSTPAGGVLCWDVDFVDTSVTPAGGARRTAAVPDLQLEEALGPYLPPAP